MKLKFIDRMKLTILKLIYVDGESVETYCELTRTSIDRQNWDCLNLQACQNKKNCEIHLNHHVWKLISKHLREQAENMKLKSASCYSYFHTWWGVGARLVCRWWGRFPSEVFLVSQKEPTQFRLQRNKKGFCQQNTWSTRPCCLYVRSFVDWVSQTLDSALGS